MDTEAVQSLLKILQTQQELNNVAFQKILEEVKTERVSQGAGKTNSPEFVIEALSASITEFTYDAENGSTFENWFARYEDLFSQDAGKLEDSAKVRLLLRKLDTSAHSIGA